MTTIRARYTCPPLTTVAQNYEGIARFDETGDEEPLRRLLRGDLILRASA